MGEEDMRSAALLLAALAGPTDQPLFLEIGRAGGEHSVRLSPGLADALRSRLALIAVGQEP